MKRPCKRPNNSLDAEKLDKGSKWADYDIHTGLFGVFGTESGFCYDLCFSLEEAEEKAREKKAS
jgi:fluoride ion exporter CrcB/FEX